MASTTTTTTTAMSPESSCSQPGSAPVLSNSRRIYSDLIAGAMAGGLAKTVIAPLDRTKIYFQTHPNKNYRFKGALKFLRLTYQKDGFLSLWRGNSATMARIIPYAGIQFMSHEQYKRWLGLEGEGPNRRPRPGLANFLAGSLAGLTGQSLTYPLDRARAVMAVTRVGDYRNLWHVFQTIVAREGGTPALYRGISPTVVGVVVYAGTSFFTYESLKYVFQEQLHRSHVKGGVGDEGDTSPNMVQRLLSGALAGLLGQTTSYPLDIVRRRMQTSAQMGINKDVYANIIGSLLHVYRTEGIFRGWYKGITMNFIKGPIAVSISFASFDYFKNMMRNLWLVVDRGDEMGGKR